MVQPHQRYILTRERESNTRYINFTRDGGCTSDGVYVPSIYSHENVPQVSGLCVLFSCVFGGALINSFSLLIRTGATGPWFSVANICKVSHTRYETTSQLCILRWLRIDLGQSDRLNDRNILLMPLLVAAFPPVDTWSLWVLFGTYK